MVAPIHTGSKGKIAEHGDDDGQDRNVPILVVLPGLRHGDLIGAQVETTQIAPSILKLLALDPHALKAVRIEHTRVLPGLRQLSNIRQPTDVFVCKFQQHLYCNQFGKILWICQVRSAR